MAKLGVNVDHVAQVRQARGTRYPDPIAAAAVAELAGADQITVHLREDRRHIQDQDVRILKRSIQTELNLEMAATDEMVRFAARTGPDWACLVPEKRSEVTTEGGLDLGKNRKRVEGVILKLRKSGVKVSCFVEPTAQAVRLSRDLGADAVELHTGQYCLATQGAFGGRSALRARSELERLRKAAILARKLGLGAHAGHGFDYENVRTVATLEVEDRRPLVEEYNIGHSIVCRAAMVGLERAVREMVSAILAP